MLKFLSLTLALLVLNSCQSGTESSEYQLSITGSESLYKTFDALKRDYEGFQDSIKVELTGGGSRRGLLSIKEGSADVGLSSFPFDLTKELGAGHLVEEKVVAYDGIVLVNHEENVITKLTNEEIKQIYNGTVTNWSQLGGPSGIIKPIMRDSNSGTQRFFIEYFGIDRVVSNAVVAADNRTIVENIWDDANAIGFIGLSYYSIGVKDLFIPTEAGANEYISPVHKNIESGAYPLRRALRIYYKADRNPGLQAFLDYLKTDRAQQVIEGVGLIPAR